MHTKRFNTFFKRWVQFRVGAIPRLPPKLICMIGLCTANCSNLKFSTNQYGDLTLYNHTK